MELIKKLIVSLLSLFSLTPAVNSSPPTITPAPTVILDTGVPNYHLIHTAFVPQAPQKNWDQPWQDACEEAALLTVHYYYHQDYPDNLNLVVNDFQQVFSFEDKQQWTHDVNLEQMAYIANQYFNYNSKIIDNPSLDQIKQFLLQNVPIIVPANGKTLYRENKHFKNGGPWYHNLVVLGYDDNVGKFIVHDVGTQFGAYYTYSYSTLLESIHDFPATGRKEDINQGSKKVLLLLQ